MKTIRILPMLLLGILSWISCQDIYEPGNHIPTVTTNATEQNVGDYVYLSGYISFSSDVHVYGDEVYFLLSTSESMNDAQQLFAEAEREYEYDGEDGYYYYCYCETTGLQPTTTYYYVLCVTDGHSEIRGAVKSFTTAAYLGIESLSMTEWNGKEEQTNFIPDGELGIYIYEEDRIVYENIYASQSGSLWKLSKDIPFPEYDLKIHAYWPYTNQAKEGYIPVQAGSDILFGTSEALNASHPNANIQMRHAMSQITFAISKEEGNPLDDTVTRIRLRNKRNDGTIKAIALNGYMDALKGRISHQDDYYHDGIFQECQFIPDEKSPYNISMIVLPSTFEEDEVVLELSMDNGYSITASLPADTWEEGTSYTYTLKISVTDFIITDVRVEEWNNNDGGNITINQ